MATILHPTLTTSPSADTHSFGLAPGASATTIMQIRSPWHSPVPYLFGGLAAMLGLIAFALLILACSYWRLSSDNENQQNDDDLEKGEGISKMKNPAVFEEKIVVIMAGNDRPTFLANPVQLFLNPTPNQDLSVGSSVSKDETRTSSSSSSSSSSSTANVDDDNDDDKVKDDDEHDQQHN